jgi:hypothetical protein
MKQSLFTIILKNLLGAALTSALSYGPAIPVQAEATSAAQTAATNTFRKTFPTPQEAADALITSTANYDVDTLLQIFGPDGKDFVSSADPVRDKSYAEAFVAKAREKTTVTIDPKDRTRATLIVGNDDWPFPVPIVSNGTKWYFDSKQGRKEILYRRIGANELDAIQICRGFVEAQKEYSLDIHDNSGVNQYAQKIISSPGKHDGLFWKNEDGTPGGPVGETVARAIEEGYSANNQSGYHGYYYKVLRGQGASARLGQLDYVINGAMIGGFALVAVPVQYRVTGVKTFMVSYDGVVYEKDLGPDSLIVVRRMDRYDPDPTWRASGD